jgi:hypothetical protein
MTSPEGLSSAAKIGIGLGVPLGVIILALIILGVYFYGRWQGRQQQARGGETPQQPPESQVYEVGGGGWKGSEMPTQANIPELPSADK